MLIVLLTPANFKEPVHARGSLTPANFKEPVHARGSFRQFDIAVRIADNRT
jgi:hypothetical protein